MDVRAFVFAMIAALAGPAMAQEVPLVVGGTLAKTVQAPPARLWARPQAAAIVPGEMPPSFALPLVLAPFVQSHTPTPSPRGMQPHPSFGLVASPRAGQAALEAQGALAALPSGPRRQAPVRRGLLAQVVKDAQVAQDAGAFNAKEGREVAWALSAPVRAVGAPLPALVPLGRAGDVPAPGVGVPAQHGVGTTPAMAPVGGALAVVGAPFAPLADSARTARLADLAQFPSRPAAATPGVARAPVAADASAQMALAGVAADVGYPEVVSGLAAPFVGVRRAPGAEMSLAAVVQVDAPSPRPTQGRRPGVVEGDAVRLSQHAQVPASMDVRVAHEAPARGRVQAWSLPILVAVPSDATPVRPQTQFPLALATSAQTAPRAPVQVPGLSSGIGAAPAPASQHYEWAPNLTAAPIPVALHAPPLPPL